MTPLLGGSRRNVEAVGQGVTQLAASDPIAYAMPLGCYATSRIVPADRLVRYPRRLPPRLRRPHMIKGLTAH